MHDFDIKTGFNNITIIFCKKCGISYVLVQYSGGKKTVWEEMPFVNYEEEPVDSPAISCDKIEVTRANS